jgi:hypothetical protein
MYEGPARSPLHATFQSDPPPGTDGRIARDARLLAVFDDYPDPDSVSFGPVQLRSGHTAFDAELGVDLVAQAVVVRPRTLLAAGVTYELVLADSLSALSGRTLPSTLSASFIAGESVSGTMPTPAPGWTRDVAPLLAGCMPGCHDATTAARGLDLTADPRSPPSGLVGVAAVGLQGGPQPLLRVAPGDSARSVLLRKLLGGGPLRIDGERMPPGGPYLDAPGLTIIERWIDAGAPD